MPSTWAKKSWEKWERYGHGPHGYPYEKWNWWDSWDDPRSYGQKSWNSQKADFREKPHDSQKDSDQAWAEKDSNKQEKPERIDEDDARDAKAESAKDSEDPKVGEERPDKPGTDEAGFSGLTGRRKLSGKGEKGEASDNWPPQPDYMCDPGWFAWNAEMAWAFGAEAWPGEFHPWDWDDKEKSGENGGDGTGGTGDETMEKLASEWERPGWQGQPGFGKRHELVPKKANLKEQFEKAESKSVTTLMLRNVPNAYDRETLMEELDHLGFAGCFNFLYLPIDSATKNNVGYAFVNFNDEKTADDCMKLNMSGYFFKGQPYNRRRAAIVSVAHLQGLEANLEHYSRTQVFFAPLPCQRPWVAPAAAQALLEKGEAAWAPLGFAKLVEDAAVRPGTEQDDQSFSRRRMREQWWGAFPGCFDCSYEMYGYFDNFDGVPPGLMPENLSLTQYHHPGQVLREELTAPEAESKEDKAGDLVDALSQMLRTGSQQVPVDDEEEGELTMMGELKQMQSMGWFGWEFFDGMERSCSLSAVNSSGMSAPSYDDQSPSLTNGSLVLLNVPLTTTEWDLRQIIEHVGVHAPITVKFEPGASSDINKVTLHFRNKIDLEIADVTLRETSWEDGGARIQIYRSKNGDGCDGTWAGYPAIPAMPPWDYGHSRSWFSKEDGDSEPRSNSLANAVGIGNDDSSSPCPPEPSFEQGTEFEKDWPKLPAARNKIADVQASQAASCA